MKIVGRGSWVVGREARRFIAGCTVALAFASPLHAQEPPQPDTPPSVASLFTKLPGDFSHLFSVGNGITLGVGGATALAIHQKDSEIARHAVTWHSLDDALGAGKEIGDGGVQAGFALGTYVVGRLAHQTTMARIGADLVRAQIVNAVLTDGLKPIADRTRPDGRDYSFPSGHTSATFATATVLQRRLGWKVGVPAYAVASYVGLSRLTENKHYASDVAFGATIGILSGRATTFRRNGGTVQIAPQASRRMAGLTVTWTADAP